MQVSPMPQTGLGSHLFVMLFGRTLSCLFISVDYDKVCSFSESFSVQLPGGFTLQYLDRLMSTILEQWGESIGLELVGTDNPVGPVILFEGKRIDGVSLIVDKHFYQEGYNSLVLSTVATLYDEQDLFQGVVKSMEVLSVSDMIFVFLEWDRISVIVLSKEYENSGKIEADEFHFDNEQVELSKSNIQNLMSVRIKKNDLQNCYSNLFAEKISNSNSIEVSDILRSYITTSLFSFKDRCFKRFGVETKDAVLVVSGSLASVLSKNDLMISVVDGLQLKGRYKVILDKKLRSVAGGVSFVKRNFVMPISDVYPECFVYLSTEKGGSGRVGRQAFKGKICSGGEEELILGQTGQIHTFNISGEGTFLINPDKYVYFPNLTRKGKYLGFDFTKDISKVVVDCRIIPVVYGPDALSNHRRLAQWRSGLNLRAEE